MALRLRVRSKAGEGVTGLALRMANRNGHPDLEEFLSAHKLRFRFESFDADMAKLAELAACPVGQLADWTAIPRGPNHVEFRSEIIPNAARLFPKSRRYCPYCLNDDFNAAYGYEPDASAAFLRGWWALNLIYACPVHRCAMKNTCPACSMRVPAGSLPLYLCSCGFQLRHADAAPLSDRELEGNAYLLGRLGVGDKTQNATLDPIPIHQVGNVMRQLGIAAVLGKQHTVQTPVGKFDRDQIYNQDPAELARLMGAGFQYARHGKESLSRLIDTIRGGEQRLARGKVALLGNKFRSWAIHEDNPIRHLMREVWDSRVSQFSYGTRGIATPAGTRVAHLDERPQLLHPLEHRRFEAELGESHPVELPRRQTLKFGKSANVLLNRVEAEQFLGLARATFEKAVTFGLLTPAWYSDASSMPAFYLREAVDLKSRSSPPGPDCQSWMDICAFDLASRYGRAALAVLLMRASRGEVGVTWPADRREKGVILTVASDQPIKDQCKITARDIAGFASLSEAAINRLASHGLIKASDDHANTFSNESVTAFLGQYISPARLVALCSSTMDSGKLGRWLITKGLSSVAPADCEPLFDRSAAIACFYDHWTWAIEHEFAPA